MPFCAGIAHSALQHQSRKGRTSIWCCDVTSSMAFWDVWILVIVLSQVTDRVQSGAILEVNMLTYNNPSSKDWNDDKCDYLPFGTDRCDHKFIFRFDAPTGNSDPETCAYAKAETDEFDNENEIIFDNEMESVSNPIRLHIPIWLGAVLFKVEVEDHDSFNGNDLVDSMHETWTVTPARSINQASWSRREIIGNRDAPPTSLVLEFRVFCLPNYYNIQCSKECIAQNGPTEHYTCDPATGDKVCRLGWEGNNCDDVIADDCIDNRCANGATCRDGHRQYTCECLAGFTGEYCATNIDECAPDPCLHGGNCTDDINGYTCECPIQYLGDTCSHHVCDDDQSACLNGGECYVEDDKAMCLCPAAFSGDACETNKCDDIICLNGGQCENGTCECRPGFLGVFCSVDLCTVNACVNGGTCDAGKCHCPPGYSGVDCSVQVNECETDPCQHDGTCRDHVDGYTCDCLPEYSGVHCEYVIPTAQPLNLDQSTTPRTAGLNANGTGNEPNPAASHSTSDTTVPVWMIGLIVALVVIVLLILLLVLFAMRRWKRKAAWESTTEQTVVFRRDANVCEPVTDFSNPNYDELHIAANGGHRYPAITPPPYTVAEEQNVSNARSAIDDANGAGASLPAEPHYASPPVYALPLPPRKVAPTHLDEASTADTEATPVMKIAQSRIITVPMW